MAACDGAAVRAIFQSGINRLGSDDRRGRYIRNEQDGLYSTVRAGDGLAGLMGLEFKFSAAGRTRAFG